MYTPSYLWQVLALGLLFAEIEAVRPGENGTQYWPGENYTEKSHGYHPIYDPDDWPVTINITSENENFLTCNEFPDINGIETGGDRNKGSTTEVFCWQYDYAKNDSLWLKTTAGCYVSIESIKRYNDSAGQEIYYEDVIPWCGRVRPYSVFDYYPEYYSIESYDVYSSAQYNIPCYYKPTNDSLTVQTGAYLPHVYCWVEGEKFGNSTKWYENARLQYGDKCYFPALWATRWGIQMPGSGGPCDYGVGDPGWWEN